MGLPSVSIQLQNGNLGLVTPSDDRVVGLVVNGNVAEGLAFGYMGLISSTQSIVGFAPAMDNTFAKEYYRQLKDFFLVAGEGAEIYVLFVDPAISTADLFTNGQISGLMDYSQGRINVIGVSRYLETEPGAPVLVEGLLADTANALDEAQALGDQLAAANTPCRFILDGRNFSGDYAGLRDLTTYTYNRVAVNLVTNRAGAHNSAMGLLLGRIASIPVNRSIGRVKDGPAPVDVAYLTSGVTINRALSANLNTLASKGYILLRQFVGRGGYYWSDDHMATKATDDYFSLANGRTIDKAARLAYATYVDELLDNVLVDADTGKIVPTALKNYQAEIERAINLTMTVAGEISGVSAFIDPNQDILATSHLYIDVRITPAGTNRAITVRLGLFNPLA